MIKATTTGLQKAQARTIAAIHRFGKLPQALEQLGADVVGGFNANIDAGAGNGRRFKALSPRYARAKARRWGAQPILVASGAMRASFGHRVVVLGPAAYRLEVGAGGVDQDGVKNGDKAIWHRDGTPRMPKRDFTRLPKRLFIKSLNKKLRELAGAGAPVPQ